MTKRSLVREPFHAVVGGIVAMTGLAPISVVGQEVQRGEKVEVTGSSIRRVQTETASPVQTVTRADIERSGKSSVAELLQTLSVDNQGSVPKSFGSGFSSGGSGISLRGLGVGATLVLLNGRRVAPYALADDGTKTYTDLNLIPLEAVERVEILKDGGSAIYGSDAIAGVVNIILRKEFNGTVVKGTVGQSLEYGDGRDTQVTVTTGFGNLDVDRYNVLGNFEYHKKEPVFNSNRGDRGYVGRTDLRSDGFTNGDTYWFFGPTSGAQIGQIAANRGSTGAGSSVVGNVSLIPPTGGAFRYFSRDDANPASGFTRSFPSNVCTGQTQGRPQGACITDFVQKYRQLLPKAEEFNFFARGSLKITDEITAFIEGNYFDARYRFQNTPSTDFDNGRASPNGAFLITPGDMAANHPDNPYFGSLARLRYSFANDLGGTQTNVDSRFSRLLTGLRGTAIGWDFDTGVMYSRNQLRNQRRNFVQADVLQALLNPTAANVARAQANSGAYAALPAGTFLRIGENAGLNSPAVYQALSPDIYAYGKSVLALGDFKASRELFNLPGGALALAIGAEVRHEQTELTPAQGTERANIIGLGYSAYALSRNVTAGYAEVAAPVLRGLELSAAGRYDHYSDAGNSFTPKAGIKWSPISQLAVRGTFQRGFRAPSAPEAGGGTSAFSTSIDPVRCAVGVAVACQSQQVAIVSAGNPDLQPERSKVFTGGFILDPTPNTSIAIDYFKIIRKNEITGGLGSNTSYITQGSVVRDPTNVSGVPGDPGILLSIVKPYANGKRTTIRGLDLDARQTLPLSTAYGKLSAGARWTHLFSFQTIDADGNVLEYAGSHGNCDVSNCIGTPADRVNVDLTYAIANWSVSALANFRAALQNRETKNLATCEHIFQATGADLPAGCRIGSFTTIDLTGRWQASREWEVFGSIQNLFDRKPPFDPTTYGAVNYNPLDYSGAVGRFFNLGARYRF